MGWVVVLREKSNLSEMVVDPLALTCTKKRRQLFFVSVRLSPPPPPFPPQGEGEREKKKKMGCTVFRGGVDGL